MMAPAGSARTGQVTEADTPHLVRCTNTAPDCSEEVEQHPAFLCGTPDGRYGCGHYFCDYHLHLPPDAPAIPDDIYVCAPCSRRLLRDAAPAQPTRPRHRGA